MNEWLQRLLASARQPNFSALDVALPMPMAIIGAAENELPRLHYLSPQQQRQLPSVPRVVSPTPEQAANEAVEDVRAQTRAVEQRVAREQAQLQRIEPLVRALLRRTGRGSR